MTLSDVITDDAYRVQISTVSVDHLYQLCLENLGEILTATSFVQVAL